MSAPRETVIAMLERQVAGRADHPAVEQGDRIVRYGELLERARRVADVLRATPSADAEPVVALAVRPGCDYVAALVGVFQAGWTCLPVDVRAPAAYNELLLRGGHACLVLGDGSLPASCAPEIARASLDVAPTPLEAADPIEEAGQAAPRPCRLDRRAFIFFTSGSTGSPKGVEVIHRGVARLVADRRTVPLTASDRIAQLAPVAFDGSTFEIWGALANGATVVVPPKWPMAPREIGRFVRDAKLSVLVITAALFALLVREAPETFAEVRLAVVGGDVVPLASVREVMRLHPRLSVFNGYGPTEDTTMSLQHRVTEDDLRSRERVPIGRPLEGTFARILDEEGREVPQGVAGELFLGGDGLARGYLDRPEETASRFRRVPGHDGVLYATGDLAVDSGDGILEFLGRRDSQVKIRGHRIELRAVEHAIREIQEVAEAAVLAAGEGAAEKRLVAFVVPRAASTADVGIELRRYLASRWPPAYVPSTVMVVDALPMTRNGKVDERELRRLLVEAR